MFDKRASNTDTQNVTVNSTVTNSLYGSAESLFCSNDMPITPTTLEMHLRSFCENPNFRVLWKSYEDEKHEYTDRLQTIQNRYPAFTTHDETHSKKIIECIENLLGTQRILELSPTDTWMILISAYAHDLGMCPNQKDEDEVDKLLQDYQNKVKTDDNFKEFEELIDRLFSTKSFSKYTGEVYDSNYYPQSGERDPYKGAVNFWEKKRVDKEDERYYKGLFDAKSGFSRAIHNYNLILQNYFRRNHALKSKEILYKEAYYKTVNNRIPMRLRYFIGDIAYCHGVGWDDVRKLPESNAGIYRDSAHPRFVAALLRLGDLLDLDSNRFNPYLLRSLDEIHSITLAHLLKHYSISDFDVKPDKIRIVARFNREMVERFDTDFNNGDDNKERDDEYYKRRILNASRLMREWMDSVERELKEFSLSWNEIAPKGFTGRIALKDKFEIIWDDREIEKDDTSLSYEISPNRAAHIIEGSGLYSSPFVFVREIVQNAVDATKIHIFREIVQNYQSYKKYLKTNNLQRPKDFSYSQLFDYLYDPINANRVITTFRFNATDKELEDYTPPRCLRIDISDSGIGITKKKLAKMKHIGEIQDEELAEEIAKMPEWLRPTGDFGIGMQSVFLAADTFRAVTYPRDNMHESGIRREIVFESTRRGGDILSIEQRKGIKNSKEIVNEEGKNSGNRIQTDKNDEDKYGTEIRIIIDFNNNLFWQRVFAASTGRLHSNIHEKPSEDLSFRIYLESHIRKYIKRTFVGDIVPLEFNFEGFTSKPMTEESPIKFIPIPAVERQSNTKEPVLFFSGNTRELLFVHRVLDKIDTTKNEYITLSLTMRDDTNSSTVLFYRGIAIESETSNPLNHPLTESIHIAGVSIKINFQLGKASNLLEINRDKLLPDSLGYLFDITRAAIHSFYDTIMRNYLSDIDINFIKCEQSSEEFEPPLKGFIFSNILNIKCFTSELAQYYFLFNHRYRDISVNVEKYLEYIGVELFGAYISNGGNNVIIDSFNISRFLACKEQYICSAFAEGTPTSVSINTNKVIYEEYGIYAVSSRLIERKYDLNYDRVIAWSIPDSQELFIAYRLSSSRPDNLKIDDDSYALITKKTIISAEQTYSDTDMHDIESLIGDCLVVLPCIAGFNEIAIGKTMSSQILWEMDVVSSHQYIALPFTLKQVQKGTDMRQSVSALRLPIFDEEAIEEYIKTENLSDFIDKNINYFVNGKVNTKVKLKSTYEEYLRYLSKILRISNN